MAKSLRLSVFAVNFSRPFMFNVLNLLFYSFQRCSVIYKFTNEAKLNDYPLTQLKKRMNNEQKKAANTDAPAEPTAEPAK
jgi:hypothetical protein